MRPQAVVCFVLWLLATVIGCTDDRHALVEGSRVAMGSTLKVAAWTGDRAGTLAAFEEVFAEFARLEQLLSTWVPRARYRA